MEEISVLQTIINGGPALILAVGIIAIWRAWRTDSQKKDGDLAAAQEALTANQEKRVEEAQCWSKKYNEVATQMKASLQNFDSYMTTVDRLAQGGRDGSPVA